MTHRILALPLLLAAAIVGLSACSSQNPGTPSPSTSASSGTTTGGSASVGKALDSVDPCSLITQQEITKNGWQQPTTVNAPGGRACRWERPDDGTTIDGYAAQVVIYDDAGLDQLNTAGGTVSNYPVGDYQGKLFQEADNCMVSVGTSSTSRVDIYVNSRLGIEQGCKLVKQVAPLVVAQFPAGS